MAHTYKFDYGCETRIASFITTYKWKVNHKRLTYAKSIWSTPFILNSEENAPKCYFLLKQAKDHDFTLMLKFCNDTTCREDYMYFLHVKIYNENNTVFFQQGSFGSINIETDKFPSISAFVILACTIEYWTPEVIEINETDDEEDVVIADVAVVRRLKKVYTEKMFTDITIDVKGKEFKAHRAVLAADSQVFAEMFDNDNNDYGVDVLVNTLTISDVEADMFELLLHYLYTGEISFPKEKLCDLLRVAHKYKIESLKEFCIVKLKAAICVKNAIEILMFTDELSDIKELNDIKEITLKFITRNSMAVTKTEGMPLLKEKPKLMNELLVFLMESKVFLH